MRSGRRSPRQAARVLANRFHAAQRAYHRYADAVLPGGQVTNAARGYRRWAEDRRRYQELPGAEALDHADDNPQLLDWLPSTPFDPHYTHQDAWAAREIFERRPAEHVDVGSRVSFVAGLAAFVPVTFIDLRPLAISLPNLTPRAGSVLDMPYGDASLESLSCLHVAEHIGLGRYGDPLDPAGTRNAAVELARVLAPGGSLYFSIPVGRPRVEFNAHRVHDPTEVAGMFPGLELASFAGVDDTGEYHGALDPVDLRGSRWACGFYRFTRG